MKPIDPKRIIRDLGVRNEDRLRALGHIFGTDSRTAGWITTGHIAAFVDDTSAIPEAGEWEWKDDYGIEPLLRAIRPALGRALELADLAVDSKYHIPFKSRQGTTCDSCDGAGFKECDLDYEHCCDVCSGTGVVGDRGRVGQRVYRRGDLQVICTDLNASVLDGLRVVCALDGNSESADPYERALIGLDDDGDVVAIVMPLRDTQPELPDQEAA